MTAPKEHASLAAALVAFQSELPKVPKDKTAKMGTYSYTYTDLATLTHTVFPLLTKHGLAFSAEPTFNAESGGYELQGTLIHSGGDQIIGGLPLHGRTPQEIGSAITYARRYLLGSMTGVVTEDDDDAGRANAAPKMEAKDWGSVIDTASGMSTVEELRGLWTSEGLGKAPTAVQATITQMVKDAEDRA